jgi:pyruvate formate lyase activating enzyme
MNSAVVTNIQGFSIHDGPGIRTVVFFKGCPLSCRWCANPECISKNPQVGFIERLCQNCGRCLENCPNDAIQPGENVYRVNHDRCDSCGRCVDNCPYTALVRYGEMMTVVEVWDKVKRDKMFYDASGGGVTVSGGEPLLNARFTKELFELCQSEGINTCVETCGFVNRDMLLEVLPLTDLFLFDLKHVDPTIHLQYTGQSNKLILGNAAYLVQAGVKIIFRQPLVIGVNDSPDHIREIAGFLNGLGENALNLQLMPYHRLGQDKYKALHQTYKMAETKIMTSEGVEAAKKAYIEQGIHCSISQ